MSRFLLGFLSFFIQYYYLLQLYFNYQKCLFFVFLLIKTRSIHSQQE